MYFLNISLSYYFLMFIYNNVRENPVEDFNISQLSLFFTYF